MPILDHWMERIERAGPAHPIPAFSICTFTPWRCRPFRSLRLAVERDDGLNYTESWAWMHPPRHALGALLAEQGQFRDAESVFRADLGFDQGLPRCCQHPNTVWALQGLAECLAQTAG